MTGHELMLREPTEAELTAQDRMVIAYDPRLTPQSASASIPARDIVWAARITGRCARYRYEREFLRRVDGEYLLNPGLYELRRADGTSQFLFFGAGDAPVEMEPEDVEAIFLRE